MPLDYLGSSLKIKWTVAFLLFFFWWPVTSGFEVVSVDPPPRWAFQIRPAAPSLSSTSPWKSIHLYSSTHYLPAPIHLPSVDPCCVMPLQRPPLEINSLVLTSVIVFSSLHPLTIAHASKERVFPIPLPEKENLSDFPLVSAGPRELWFPQMNSVRELDLIEKTQAWSAMEEMVPVSQLNCVNVLSRAGEGERRKEKNTRFAETRGQAED